LKYKESPRLFSIIFGEAIANDAVGIILFQTFLSLKLKYSVSKGASTNLPEVILSFIANFLLLALCSLLIGIVCGLLGTLMIKKFRFLTISVVKETLVILVVGFIAYFIADAIEYSGIISLLAAGVVMARYAWHNLSIQGKIITGMTFNTIGYLSESFVFVYLGIVFYNYYEYNDKKSGG
jgi:sodium/hydrogen exchanger-like protein 6/7/sodium/hydrogen exchanger 8